MSSTPLYLFLDIIIIIAAAALWLPLYKRLDKTSKGAAILTIASLSILASAFQYLCLVRVGAWSVCEQNTWLLPVRLLGSPLEEYLFWWGFAFIMTAAYLWPRNLFFRKESDVSKSSCESYKI
jgi:hypothetical protein